MTRILVVEDERHLAEGLRFNLEAEGFEVAVAESGEDALEKLQHTSFDAMVLDIMLPGMDGFEVATHLRRNGNFIPTLMLTARGRPEDVLRGFEAGADDYLAKPFDLAILLARVRGLLRRKKWLEPASQNNFSFGNHTIDFENLELIVEGRSIPLTKMEADLLKYMVEREGRTVTRKALLEDVWGVNEDTDTRAIDNFIVRLRRHLEKEPSRPRHLLTVRGMGYKFLSQPEK